MAKRFDSLEEMKKVLVEPLSLLTLDEQNAKKELEVTQEEYDWYVDRLKLADPAARRATNKAMEPIFHGYTLKIINVEPAE